MVESTTFSINFVFSLWERSLKVDRHILVLFFDIPWIQVLFYKYGVCHKDLFTLRCKALEGNQLEGYWKTYYVQCLDNIIWYVSTVYLFSSQDSSSGSNDVQPWNEVPQTVQSALHPTCEARSVHQKHTKSTSYVHMQFKALGVTGIVNPAGWWSQRPMLLV